MNEPVACFDLSLCVSDGEDSVGQIDVSVIVPVYNGAAYLDVALTSILEQDGIARIEVIVVDDGSGDSSVDTARRILGSQQLIDWHIVELGCNRGVSAARNAGIDASRGRFLAFLDADDYLDRGQLRRLLAMAEESEADFVFCGYSMERTASGNTWCYTDHYGYPQSVISGPAAVLLVLQRRIHVWTGAFAVRRSLIQGNRLSYVVGCMNGQDFEFHMKCLFHATRVAAVPQDLGHYVRRPHGPNRQKTLRRFDSVGAISRLAGHLDANAAPELASIIRSNTLPLAYMSILGELVGQGWSLYHVTRLAQHPYIKQVVAAFDRHGTRVQLLSWYLFLHVPYVWTCLMFLRGRLTHAEE